MWLLGWEGRRNKDTSDIVAKPNLKLNTNCRHFEGELNPSLISNFAQCNSKSHPSHPNVNKPHNLIRNQAQSLAQSPNLWKQEHLNLVLWKEQNLLRSSTNLDFLILPSYNSLLIQEVFLNIKLLCKHADNCVQMQTQPVAQLIFHECKNGESLFIFYRFKH